MNTNWSTPKTNIIAGINDLRKALSSGQNAVLIRARNEDCEHPIKTKVNDVDFRNYEFNIGYLSTRQDIIKSTNMSEFHKYLSLNYKTCYGTQEAVKKYYESGCLSKDNFKGMGVSHLVKVEDMVRWLLVTGDTERAEMFRKQYLTLETANERHFYDFYRYKHGSLYIAKKFRKKLWVVELLKPDETKARIPWMHKILLGIITMIVYPLKFIPRKSVLKMKEYKVVTFRVGDVINGLSIEFHIPKKFSFN